MENLKLISVRIDPKTLEKVNALVKKHYYWKRNTIINGLLTAVVDAMNDKALYEMVCYDRRCHKDATGSFSLENTTRSQSAANERSE